MELRVLRYFLAICQEKNITSAASRLHISQPSLSRQIKELEGELGVTLFIRGHRQITLTEDGYFLRDRAREMVAIADNTVNSLERRQVVSGELNIGAGQTPALESVMRIIDRLIATYPKVKVNFTDANADLVEKQVKQGSLNFGIVMGDRPLHEFNSIILPQRNQFVAVFSPRLLLAQKEKVSPYDLVGYPITLSNQSFVSDKFHGWWGNLAGQVQTSFSANLAYNSSLLAKQGHLVQITYAGLVNTGAGSGLVERPLTPKITDPNILIWKRGVRQSQLANLFIKQVRAMVDADC